MTTRPEAVCPQCRSLERHRLAFLLLGDELAADQRVLHVAPEPPIASWLQRISRPDEYLSIDLAGTAMRRMDLTALELPDESRTLVWCSHVLEHIPDDRAAMREMHRVLAVGGLAVVQVPIHRDATYEDFSITAPEDRRRAFMQEDHVRIYGPDIVARLTQAGFDVRVRRAADLPTDVVRRHAVACAGTDDVFLCRRSA